MAETQPALRDATLRIKFAGERIPYDFFRRKLHSIDSALMEDERQEAMKALEYLQVSPLLRDGILYRLNKMHAEHYFIQAAKPGSLEVVAIIAASTYFLLQKTIGQSVSEGYLSSDLHAKLRDWTSRSINEKLTRVAERLKKSPIRLEKETIKIKDGEILIEVPEQKSEGDLPPTYSQLALPAPEKKPEPKKKSDK